ncbi:MAG: hypothetical protein CMJ25_01205 [Phycisphaerae bacterium]|nr:hypothetical protein [Phycisphaerae bacterium]
MEMVNLLLCFSFYNNYNINYKIMNNISNTIKVEYEHFILEVDYDWRKGNAGDYFNPPEPNETDIKKVILMGYINDNGNIQELDTAVKFNINQECEQQILEEISNDVENFM